MLNFESDYIHGAHEKILSRLIETNFEPLSGYGEDKYSISAKDKIKNLCGDNSQVFFLNGGTQTNKIVIDSMLSSTQGVISADTGHINSHEAGAIESSGHKVLTIPQKSGKLDAKDISAYLESFYSDETHAHCVYPGMVYISHPTELGTLYTRNELKSISEVCRKYDIPLFLDGARLGYGLMANDADVTIKDIATLCDVFYIGGTKVGALCGEAVVFTHNNSPKHFFTIIKQHGALLAKGRVLSLQFDTLFTDNLYFDISQHAIAMAQKLSDGLTKKGYDFYVPTVTNQIFVVVDNKKLEEIKKQVRFVTWEKLDNSHTVVRFVTCWATKPEEIEKLLSVL